MRVFQPETGNAEQHHKEAEKSVEFRVLLAKHEEFVSKLLDGMVLPSTETTFRGAVRNHPRAVDRGTPRSRAIWMLPVE
jgi:hypothetical protein